MARPLLVALLLCSTFAVKAQKQANDGWPEYGGTLAGQRYSSAREIRADNVSGLQVAWTFHTHALDKASSINWRASFESTPILWNGVLYFDTPFDAIFAVDAVSGRQIWTYDPQINRERPIYIASSRGVSLWHAKKPSNRICGRDAVLVATLDRRLIARDAATGDACPKFGRNGEVDLAQGVQVAEPGYYGFTSPVTVVGDTIVVGSSIGDNQDTFVASGAVRGFDAITGRQKWSWEPIRWTSTLRPGMTGSGNAWSVISADPKHNLIFVPTGSPSVDFYGGTRPGDDRDADSLVALQASTGKKVWSFQLVHHDIWDYDTPSEPVLFTFRGKIPAVAVTTKTSMVYVFNRLTGKPLYPIVERPVAASTLPGEQAWPTQPFSTLPPLAPLSFTAEDIHLHDPKTQAFCVNLVNSLRNQGLFTPSSRDGSLMFPGSAGGANWGAAAFDPTTSTLYTRVSNLPYIVEQITRPPEGEGLNFRLRRAILRYSPEWAGGNPPPLTHTFLTPDGGETRDLDPQRGTPYRLARQALLAPDGTPCGPQPFGLLVAINLNSGKKMWSVANGEMTRGEAGSTGLGGVIATAGGLLFLASSNDGFLRAFDSITGKEVWRGKLPAAANATPMTYSIHGRQFVVIQAGGHPSLGTTQSDAVVAFALPETKTVTETTHH